MKHKIHFMVMIMSIILMPLYAEVLSIKKDVQSKINKTKLIKEVLEIVKKNPAYNDLDDEEKEDLIIELRLRIKWYDKEWVSKLLLEYGYSNDFAEKESNKIPIKLSWTPKITTEELENLAKLKFKDVIDSYLKTWKIPKWFESFEEDLKEIKKIIKETEALIRRWEEAEWKIKKLKEIDEKMNWLIKEMKKIKLRMIR